jgi:hypothetical protein
VPTYNAPPHSNTRQPLPAKKRFAAHVKVYRWVSASTKRDPRLARTAAHIQMTAAAASDTQLVATRRHAQPEAMLRGCANLEHNAALSGSHNHDAVATQRLYSPWRRLTPRTLARRVGCGSLDRASAPVARTATAATATTKTSANPTLTQPMIAPLLRMISFLRVAATPQAPPAPRACGLSSSMST